MIEISAKHPKILFVCTGNSCRSPIAEGLANQMGFTARSGGIEPADSVNANSVVAMKEVGIDISAHVPKSVETYIDDQFDIIVSLGEFAKLNLPNFSKNIGQIIYQPFPDPYNASGTEAEILDAYRVARDAISIWLKNLTLNNQ